MPQRREKRPYALMLPLLAALLPSCGTTLPNSGGNFPALPPQPVISEPMPLQTYSASAQRDIQSWRKRLTDTQTMSER
jgi:hypothetical protein